jgi:ribokinase
VFEVDVLVIGSLNHDIVAGVDQAPAPGETVLARTLVRTNGGKGGNQAVAAARAGASVRLLSAVGTDAEGDMQVTSLAAFGVDTSVIAREAGQRTSLALIWVTPDGENSIIVTPGAKDRVTPELVWQLGAGLAPRVVLAQSEVGAAVCDAAAGLAAQVGARYVLSCGPVVLPAATTLAACDPVIVNAGEARDLLAGVGAVATGPETELTQALLAATGARSVVVTLGASGSVVAERDGGTVRLPAVPATDVVDTTGAGDTYCGVVVARIAQGDALADAAREAAVAASAAVGWRGARPELV